MTDDYDAVMGKDRIPVGVRVESEAEATHDTFEHDGELYQELTVWNHASVTEKHYCNSVNGYETFPAGLAAGDDPTGPVPEAITERLATLLYDEFGIEAEDRGIRVINVTDDDVVML